MNHNVRNSITTMFQKSKKAHHNNQGCNFYLAAIKCTKLQLSLFLKAL